MENKLWEYIQPRMDAVGLNMSGLALKAGVSQSHMHYVKYGSASPRDETLERIGRAIDGSIGALRRLRNKQDVQKRKITQILNPKSEIRNSKSKISKAWPLKRVICNHCGKPGKARSAWSKFPHPTCKLEHWREYSAKSNREFYGLHGSTRQYANLKKITQNDILLTSLKQEGKRVCLKCDKKFKSNGPWNRLCPHCKNLNDRGIQEGQPYKVIIKE